MDLSTAQAFDVLVLLACGGLVLTKGGAGHSHPAVIYLIFHGLVVTGRAFAISTGVPTFLSSSQGYEGVSLAEVTRGMFIADLTLIAATVGWMTARKRLRPARSVSLSVDSSGDRWRLLRPKLLRRVAIVALPIGIIVFALYGFVPGLGAPSATSTSSYLTLALTWPGLILVALIYYRGFRFLYIAPLSVYLVIIALQGYGRFRLIVPVILLVQIYLDRRGRRWPDVRAIGVLVLIVLLFFPLKLVGRAVQDSVDPTTIRSDAGSVVSDALSGRSDDQAILDQLAMTLALTDRSGQIFLGKPYLNVLVLPIPRQLWKGKPGLGDHLRALSTPSRPLNQLGTVPTLPGDLYLNFRLPGLLLFMFLLARWSARLYEAAYRRPYRSVGRFAFLLLSCNLIQIYRDGLISVPVFLLVQMLPLVVLVALHARQSDGAERPAIPARKLRA